MPRIYTRTDPVIRFWSKVNKNGPVPEHRPELGSCWVWTGPALNTAGHGSFYAGRKPSGGDLFVVASRFAYEVQTGPIPNGHYVCHHCDNPPCVRGSHLFASLPQGNFDDMVSKGREGYRKNKSKGSAHYNAKLSEADVLEIRRLRAEGSRVKDIPAQFGVSLALVEKILGRTVWTHI